MDFHAEKSTLRKKHPSGPTSCAGPHVHGDLCSRVQTGHPREMHAHLSASGLPFPGAGRSSRALWTGRGWRCKKSMIWLCTGQNQQHHFRVGAPPILVYFSWDWDVHWGYGLLTHGHMSLSQDEQMDHTKLCQCAFGFAQISLASRVPQEAMPANKWRVPKRTELVGGLGPSVLQVMGTWSLLLTGIRNGWSLPKMG